MMVNPIGAGVTPVTTAMPVAPVAAAVKAPIDDAQLESAVKAANAAMAASASAIEFHVDRSSGKTIVRITDKQTQTVIRQIPSEEMLEIAQAIDRFEGMLLNQKA